MATAFRPCKDDYTPLNPSWEKNDGAAGIVTANPSTVSEASGFFICAHWNVACRAATWLGVHGTVVIVDYDAGDIISTVDKGLDMTMWDFTDYAAFKAGDTSKHPTTDELVGYLVTAGTIGDEFTRNEIAHLSVRADDVATILAAHGL